MSKIQRMWTSEEDKYLLDNYKTMSYVEIGKELSRTEESVKGKAIKVFGLRKSTEEIMLTKGKLNTHSRWKGGIYSNETKNLILQS